MQRSLSLFRKLSTPLKRNYNICIGGVNETIESKHDSKWKNYNSTLKFETMAVIGYGPQGRSQSLNLRDNKCNVIVGVRKGVSWDKAISDGWIPDKSLFEVKEAVSRGTIIQYLVSDASQITLWNDSVLPNLNKGNALCFSHGFGITFQDQTNIIPPSNIDVFLVAPKGPGSMVREKMINGGGVNSSYAIHHDYTSNATKRCLSLAFAIGSENVFETTFQKEVYSDLTGERCTLMGMIQGAFKAQYDVLREKGHSPSEAYNETVEEALASLYPLIHRNGMDWMFSNCSTTAQRGALDWAPKFYEVIKPVIEQCYSEVANGNEARRSIDSNSDINYRSKLDLELKEIQSQEIWQTAKALRSMSVAIQYQKTPRAMSFNESYPINY
jgi:ketol-acid reductoisomerase